MEYFFESKKNSNYIKLILHKISGEVNLESYYIDDKEYEYVKDFCELLKNGFELVKKDGGEIFIQNVSKYEWENYLKKNDMWEIINVNNNNEEFIDRVIIACCVSDAPKCIIEGFLEIETNTDNN